MKNKSGDSIFLRIDWFIDGMSITDSNIMNSNTQNNFIEVHTSKNGRMYSQSNLGEIK